MYVSDPTPFLGIASLCTTPIPQKYLTRPALPLPLRLPLPLPCPTHRDVKLENIVLDGSLNIK